MTSLIDIMETATKPEKSWSNLAVARFHYFNPNGLIARKRRNDQAIADLVDAGKVPAGWHLAYGTMDSYSSDQLIALTRKRRVDGTSLRVAIEMLRRSCEEQEAKIAEAKNA